MSLSQSSIAQNNVTLEKNKGYYKEKKKKNYNNMAKDDYTIILSKVQYDYKCRSFIDCKMNGSTHTKMTVVINN